MTGPKHRLRDARRRGGLVLRAYKDSVSVEQLMCGGDVYVGRLYLEWRGTVRVLAGPNIGLAVVGVSKAERGSQL